VEELLEVGDSLIVTNGLGCVHKYRITRVTKKLAKSLREDDGYEYTFKRHISHDMSHPHQRWNQSVYTVERCKED